MRPIAVLSLSTLWPRCRRGILLGWLKGAGEKVEPGDLMAVVMMASGIREVRSKRAGVISNPLVRPGTILMPEDEVVRIRVRVRAGLPKHRTGRGLVAATLGKHASARGRNV